MVGVSLLVVGVEELLSLQGEEECQEAELQELDPPGVLTTSRAL